MGYFCKLYYVMCMKRLWYVLVTLLVVLSACERDPWSKTDEENSGPYPSHPEIPAQVSNSNYQYVTHYGAIMGETVRNFTLCYDKTVYAARWVAYPLHTCYRGSTDRSYSTSEVWPQDPEVDAEQAVGKGGYAGRTRGHQIPSADRTINRELNAQTFYMSNMTPQVYDFNGAIWLDLESKVRDNMCKDTLYVVTGAHWENTSEKAGKYPVPTHYYKVLLRTRSGNTHKSVFNATRDELMCVGFWLSHTDRRPLTDKYMVSVEEIERKTGFTFFPKVDVDKSRFNPSDWK